MKEPIVIAGSGKMARDLGLHLLKRGHPVTWLSRDPERLESLRERIERTRARVDRLRSPGDDVLPPATFGLVGEGRGAPPAAIVECVEESVEAKREVFRLLARLTAPSTALLSVSSSILPSEIHRRCAGAHFFYPVELTGLAEAVLPEALTPPESRRVIGFLQRSGFRVMVQDERNAFAANRLLLPLQAECFRALRLGAPPAEVDDASRSPLHPMGQLSLMDTVGLDVIRPAVVNYLRRMSPEEAADHSHLPAGLGELLALGKRGRKNGDGLLMGGPMPWAYLSPDPADRTDLAATSLYLLLNTCYHFRETGQLDGRGLRLVLTNLFQAQSMPEEILGRERPGQARARLEELHRATGRSYFKPAAALGEGESRIRP